MKNHIRLEDSKILVTGGLGFIGSNFILNLFHKFPNCSITNLDAEFVGSNKENLKQIAGKKGYHYVKGNITNTEKIKRLIQKCDIVFNFAAESHVDRSIDHPGEFILGNTALAYNMLEFAREVKPEVFLQFSTDEVYGDAKIGESHKEWSTILPSNPYSASKAAQEAYAYSYWRTFGVPVVITNTMNNIGEWQDCEKFLQIGRASCRERV